MRALCKLSVSGAAIAVNCKSESKRQYARCTLYIHIINNISFVSYTALHVCIIIECRLLRNVKVLHISIYAHYIHIRTRIYKSSWRGAMSAELIFEWATTYNLPTNKTTYTFIKGRHIPTSFITSHLVCFTQNKTLTYHVEHAYVLTFFVYFNLA